MILSADINAARNPAARNPYIRAAGEPESGGRRGVSPARNNAPCTAFNHDFRIGAEDFAQRAGAPHDRRIFFYAFIRKQTALHILSDGQRVPLGGNVGRIGGRNDMQAVKDGFFRKAQAVPEFEIRIRKRAVVDPHMKAGDRRFRVDRRQRQRVGKRQRTADHNRFAARSFDRRFQVAKRGERRASVARCRLRRQRRPRPAHTAFPPRYNPKGCPDPKAPPPPSRRTRPHSARTAFWPPLFFDFPPCRRAGTRRRCPREKPNA